METTHPVKMDYKPRDRVRPLFHKKKDTRILKILSLAGICGVLTLFLTTNKSINTEDFAPEISASKSKINLIDEVPLPEMTEVIKVNAEIEPITQTHWTSLTVESGDSLAKLFNKANILPAELNASLNIGKHATYLKKIHPGQTIKILKDSEGKLLALEQQIDKFKTLQIERNENRFISTLIEAPIENRLAYGRVTIHDSLFLDGKRANLEDKLIMAMSDIFAYDIDFALDIRPEDSFKVLYEEQYVNGEKIGVGSILSAEFVNQGKKYQAVRYSDENGKGAYYTPTGNSLEKAFIRTPVNYTRISSHFNLTRKHPVLHRIRAHKGVDYAAPHGTPIKAAGAGKVAFIGGKGGYGNTIILQHGPKYTTLYAHMARFNKKLKKGSTVSQGEIIGYVGSSGLATGPHLHYEFRINGSHRNPLTVALPQSKGILKTMRDDFFLHSKNLLALMEHHDQVMLAQSEVK